MSSVNVIIITSRTFMIHSAFSKIWKTVDNIELVSVVQHKHLYAVLCQFTFYKNSELTAATELEELFIAGKNWTRDPIIATFTHHIIP